MAYARGDEFKAVGQVALTAPTRFTLQGGAVAATFIVAAIGAAAGGQALAPLCSLCALIVLFRADSRQALGKAIKHYGFILFLWALFWLYLGLTGLWSPQEKPKTLMAVMFYLPVLTVFAWSVSGANPVDRKLALRAGVAFVFIVAVLAAVEGVFQFPFYSAERGGISNGRELISARHTLAGAGSALAVLVWPVVTYFDKKGGWVRLIAIIPVILAFVIGHYSHASSILLAMVVGGFLYLAGRAYPRATLLLLGLIIMEFLVAAPRIAELWSHAPQAIIDILPASYRHRIEIWSNASSLIEQRTWFGWGLDASKTFNQPYMYKNVGPGVLIPWHPHNVPLHLWLETGFVGISLFCAVVLVFTLSLVRGLGNDRQVTAGAVGAIGAFSVFAGVSFGAWQAWFLTTGFAAAGLIAALSARDNGGLYAR